MKLKLLPLFFRFFCFVILSSTSLAQNAAEDPPTHKRPEFSTAGFFPQENSPRKVYNINNHWDFTKQIPSTDSDIITHVASEKVHLPHGLESLPEEASGCINYQGQALYSRLLTIPKECQNKRLTLHFEGIMGKSEIFLNGKSLKKHYGGYLPLIVDITPYVQAGKTYKISLIADNSDDPDFPPGKPQKNLDFCYFGGIYRDAYLIATNPLHITDANEEDIIAGGGIRFATLTATPNKATTRTYIHLRNTGNTDKNVTVSVELKPWNETTSKYAFKGTSKSVSIPANQDHEFIFNSKVNTPNLWSPHHPYLYALYVTVKDNDTKKTLDVYKTRVGLRTFTLDNEHGFCLNGEPYPGKILGANRHQDFACLGNAISNIGHWRDAKKLRDAGFCVIRSAHFPQDPAFMDACDELGLFVIGTTSGWQFWNNKPIFQERVFDNISQLIRRDRNHASIWLWEPILNESPYPQDFASKAYKLTHKEMPEGSCYAACDDQEKGSTQFDILYGHPLFAGQKTESAKSFQKGKPYFTREFGDNVDNWDAHNSPSRASRSWGETPMLIQAKHYLAPYYPYTCVKTLKTASIHHVGGALWHSFDHQRGYHPDPFYGGIMDAFRRPKTSYYAFQSQRPISGSVVSGPYVYIAHTMTPFSPRDITVFSNAQKVSLSIMGQPPISRPVVNGMAIFEQAFDWQKDKELSRQGKGNQVTLEAKALIDSQVVATHTVRPARRVTNIKLTADTEGVPLYANGEDFCVITATMCDAQGTPKRLNNEKIRFSVIGDAEIVARDQIGTNPANVEWGEASIILRMGTKPGKVIIQAAPEKQGVETPHSASLTLDVIPSPQKEI